MKVVHINQKDGVGGAAGIAYALFKSDQHAEILVGSKSLVDSKITLLPKSKIRSLFSFVSGSQNILPRHYLDGYEQVKQADIIHLHNIQGRYLNLEEIARLSRHKPVVWTVHDEWALSSDYASVLGQDKVSQGLYEQPDMKNVKQATSGVVNKVFLREAYKNYVYNHRKIRQYKTEMYNRSRFHLVAPSEWMKQRVAATSLGQHPITVIPNGVDTDVFKPKPKRHVRKRLSLPMDKKILLFAAEGGAGSFYKGWNFVSDIVDRTARDDWLFLCLGNYKKNKGNSKVKYLGYLDKMKMADYYNASDVLLYPSMADSFGLVVAEAMACGLPPVIFDKGGLSELVDHRENGFIVRSNNFKGFEQGIEWLLGLSDGMYAKISRKCEQRSNDNFNKYQMINAYLRLYREIINS